MTVFHTGTVPSWPPPCEDGIYIDLESGTSIESCSLYTDPPPYQRTIPDVGSHHSQYTSETFVTATSHAKLPLPIAIPQISKNAGAPFMRLYSRLLESHGISETEFIKFVDGLNEVSAASPPIKVIGIVGGVISMVPHRLAKLTSDVIQGVGTAICNRSTGKTESFIQAANESMFGCHGLQVRLLTTDALLAIIHFPEDQDILTHVDWSVAHCEVATLHNRLLDGLKGYIAPSIGTTIRQSYKESTIDELNTRQLFRDIDRMNKGLSQRVHDHSENVAKQLRRTKSKDKELRKIKSRMEKVNSSADARIQSGNVDIYKLERKRVRTMKRLCDRISELLLREEEENIQKLKRLERKAREDNTRHENQEHDYVRKLLWVVVEPL